MIAAHPALLLFGTALAAAIVPARLRPPALLIGTSAALAATIAIEPGAVWSMRVASFDLILLDADPLSRLFGLIFALIALLGTIYALHVRTASEHAATMSYAGAAVGLVFAGDWITVLACWELMGLTSLAVIWHGGWRGSRSAGFRYLLVHAFGGSLFLAGILVHLATGGSQQIGPLSAIDSGLAYGLILIAVAINAAVPPLHAWLTDAYPEASVTGTVFLSAFTTKGAVYLLMRAFPGSELLVWAGVAMALYGVVYAVLENDIRRLLAYHIVSQVGYMVAGVGMGTAMSLDGTAAHAFCHILYKALLLMGAGAVLAATGRRKLTELGGIGRRMPAVVLLYMVGAFSISAVPLFNGFVSKTMIISAAAGEGRGWAELLLTLASVGTFLHTGLKLPYFTFFGPDRDVPVRPLPRNMLAAMALASALCIGLGLYPEWLYARLPFQPVTYEPYTFDHIISEIELLFGTGIGFWLLLRKLGGEPTMTLDTDWFYRRPLARLLAGVITGLRAGGQAGHEVGAGMVAFLRRVIGAPSEAGTPDTDIYRQPLGSTVLWVLALLVALAMLRG